MKSTASHYGNFLENNNYPAIFVLVIASVPYYAFPQNYCSYTSIVIEQLNILPQGML